MLRGLVGALPPRRSESTLPPAFANAGDATKSHRRSVHTLPGGTLPCPRRSQTPASDCCDECRPEVHYPADRRSAFGIYPARHSASAVRYPARRERRRRISCRFRGTCMLTCALFTKPPRHAHLGGNGCGAAAGTKGPLSPRWQWLPLMLVYILSTVHRRVLALRATSSSLKSILCSPNFFRVSTLDPQASGVSSPPRPQF